MPRPAARKSNANLTVLPVGRNRAEQDRILARAARAWEMRIAEVPMAEIARELGVSTQMIDADLRLMENRVPSLSAQERRAWRQIQVAQHRAVIAHHLPAATGGPVKIPIGGREVLEVEHYVGELSFKAAGVVLAHMQAQAKVLQLDIVDKEDDIDPDAATPEERMAMITLLAARLSDRQEDLVRAETEATRPGTSRR